MIIAESGTAWAAGTQNKRWDNIKSYINAAAKAGADYFKIQMFVPGEPLFCPLQGDEKRWERWGNAYFPFDTWLEIKSICKQNGIGFMASAFQHTTVEWLNQLGVDYHKVASRAYGTYPYDKAIGKLIISTRDDSPGYGWGRVKYIHCISKYPTALKDARWPDNCDGLSDHSGTPWPAIDALARGAEIVEVHFKLDDDGPDAASSVTVDELKMICDFQKALKEMGG